MTHSPPSCVLITGGAGNLGQKISAHLQQADWCQTIIVLDRTPAPETGKIKSIIADLTDPRDTGWHAALAEADAVIHLAADNPYPDASWAEACRSFDMTANLLARRREKPLRFILASSNHTMGGYKEEEPAAGTLTPVLPPKPGTRFHTPAGFVQERGYATAKLMGERAVVAAAEASNGLLTAVNLRIGWCQPGDNNPATITGDGMPFNVERIPYPGAERDLLWFRHMWLSNCDMARAMTCALRADATGWPMAAVTVNAMSNNSGMPWSLAEGRALLDYSPSDDVWDCL